MRSPTSSGVERAVDAPQHAAVLVVADERLGLFVVLAEAVADHLGLVVVAHDELAAADVAHALAAGRVELDMEDVALLDAGPPAAEPPHDLLVGDVDQDRRGQLAAEALELGVERLRLAAGAGKPVEDEAVGGLLALDALRDHADDHLVGHEVAAVHVLLRLAPDLGLVAHRRAKDVARRVVGQPEIALAGARPGSPCPTRAAPEEPDSAQTCPHPPGRDHFRNPS